MLFLRRFQKHKGHFTLFIWYTILSIMHKRTGGKADSKWGKMLQRGRKAFSPFQLTSLLIQHDQSPDAGIFTLTDRQAGKEREEKRKVRKKKNKCLVKFRRAELGQCWVKLSLPYHFKRILNMDFWEYTKLFLLRAKKKIHKAFIFVG